MGHKEVFEFESAKAGTCEYPNCYLSIWEGKSESSKPFSTYLTKQSCVYLYTFLIFGKWD